MYSGKAFCEKGIYISFNLTVIFFKTAPLAKKDKSKTLRELCIVVTQLSFFYVAEKGIGVA